MGDTQEATERASLSKHLRRYLWRVTCTAIVSYLAICLFMVAMETQLVYPVPSPRESPSAEDFGFEDVRFASADGTSLHGWFYPHKNARLGILYCHGNGEDITYNADLVRWYHDNLSASVFIFDYRGYGQSEGSPHEEGLIADGLAAQEWLAKRMRFEPDELVLIGRSLGGGVAVAIAERLGASALVLQNTFPSMTEVAASKYPWLPVRLLMRNRFPSRDRIKSYVGPLLQSHGTADEIVPFPLARELFEISGSKQKTFFEIPGGTHNSQLPNSYLQTLVEFLTAIDPLD